MTREAKELILEEIKACDAFLKTENMLKSIELEFISALERVEADFGIENLLLRRMLSKLKI